MNRPFTTTLVVCTWNEIDGMKAIMPRVKREWVDQILVMDGGSKDGTIEYAIEQGYDVHVQRKAGFRHGYNEIMPLVRGDVMLTFSPDGNSVPELIPELLNKLQEGYDMVIASRYLPGAKSEDDDMVTAFGNWLFTKTTNLLHKGNYTDVMVIYRAYYKRVVEQLKLTSDRAYESPERWFGTKISWEPLLSVRAAKHGLKIAEIAGDEPPRVGGVRKLQILRWGAAYYYQMWREFFRSRPE